MKVTRLEERLSPPRLDPTTRLGLQTRSQRLVEYTFSSVVELVLQQSQKLWFANRFPPQCPSKQTPRSRHVSKSMRIETHLPPASPRISCPAQLFGLDPATAYALLYPNAAGPYITTANIASGHRGGGGRGQKNLRRRVPCYERKFCSVFRVLM